MRQAAAFLSGQIKRGDAETIRAALVMVDMRNSSNVADVHGRQVFIETLNEFYDAIAALQPQWWPDSQLHGRWLPRNLIPARKGASSSRSWLHAQPCRRRGPDWPAWPTSTMTGVAKGLWEIDFGVGLHVGNVIFAMSALSTG